jgi:hypothetical protein
MAQTDRFSHRSGMWRRWRRVRGGSVEVAAEERRLNKLSVVLLCLLAEMDVAHCGHARATVPLAVRPRPGAERDLIVARVPAKNGIFF